MSDSGILMPEDRLDGPRLVNIGLRPLRLGFLVPDDNPEIAVRVIESCSMTWGGLLNAIIPYSKEHGLTDEWSRVLNVLDPDNLVDCAGISDIDKETFRKRHQHVHTWENPINTFFTVGALQYSGLNAFGEFLKSESPRHIVTNPVVASSDPMYLPVIARHGRINELFVEETRERHGWASSVSYEKFATVENVGFAGSGQVAIPGNFSPPSGTTHFHDPITLTLLGTTHRPASYSFGKGTPEHPQHDNGYVQCVVITGDPGSVSDLALYWNLRIERPMAGAFPLWIPLDLLDSEEGRTAVDSALLQLDQRLREWPGHSPSLHIVSSSTPGTILESRLTRFPDATPHVQGFHEFLTGACVNNFDSDQREVNFNSGGARIPLPNPSALQKFAPMDRIVHEISIGGFHLPTSDSLNSSLWGDISVRITRNGSLEGFSLANPWPAFTNIGIPDTWTILTSVFEDAGYVCSPSDKGRLASGQLELLGGIKNAGIIGSSKIYELLRELSLTKGQEGRPRLFSDNRPIASYSKFAGALGKEIAKPIVNWLVDTGVLLRDIQIKCPKCQLKLWYEVDRIGRTWRCNGCQSSQPIPIGPDSAQWSYRINELYAVGHDQGTITHILGVYNLFPPRNTFSRTSNLGYSLGVDLKARPDAVVPVAALEVDIVGILDGRLIMCECKDSGKSLSKDDAHKLADVANHLDCSRLLFVTATEFPDAEAFFEDVGNQCRARLEYWERGDMFDQLNIERIGNRPTGLTDEERPTRYLKELVKRLGEQTGQRNL